MKQNIFKYVEAFQELRVNRGNQYVKQVSLLKPCLLLAVIDAIQAKCVNANRIYYEPYLLERFDRYFDIANPGSTNRRPWYPFFYLNSADFWELHPNTKTPYTDPPSSLSVSEEIKFVSLADDLYACLLDCDGRETLRQVLIEKWFTDKRRQVWAVIKEVQQFSENDVSILSAPPSSKKWIEVQNKRERAFRRRVLEAYQYECAATGWKLASGQDSTLLEAAHIMPLEEKIDNRVQNGIALIPTIHKAMDKFLITPQLSFNMSTPAVYWHVSEFVREQKSNDLGAKWLSEFHQQPVRLPVQPHFHPCSSVLEWRMSKLIRK